MKTTIPALLCFLCGLAIGHFIPAHRYAALGATPYVLDTSTGLVCTPIRSAPTPDQDAYWTASAAPQAAPATLPLPDYMPACR